jgi:hypothetical protein
MERKDYGGGAGYAPSQDPATIADGAALSAARDARRDLLARVPYGRALDDEDLVSMLDEGNQANRAITLRRRLLARMRTHLPSAVMLTSEELEQLRADSLEHPTRPGPAGGIPEWPA